jgi:general secretion pathway protein I
MNVFFLWRTIRSALRVSPIYLKPVEGPGRVPGPLERTAGFTLVEVLVALAILAIALAAAMRTLHLTTDSAQETKLRLLATWVAQNQLAESTAKHEFPAPGISNGNLEYAGVKFAWQHNISGTPNAAFRKLEIRVTKPDDTAHALAQLTGYLVQASP